MASARAGDARSFEELVRRTSADTYTLAVRLVGDEADAHDVVQEAYLRAYRGLSGFRGDARFSTWLYRITANCAATYVGRRRRHRHDPLLDDDLVDGHADVDPAAHADATSLRDRVEVALDQLAPRLRAVVVLRDVYDLTNEEIAAELGISPTAAKVRLHRARRRLRAVLFPARDDAVSR